MQRQTGGVVQLGPVASPGRQLAGCPIGQAMLHDGHGPTTGAVHEDPEAAGFGARERLEPHAAIIATISRRTVSFTMTRIGSLPSIAAFMSYPP